MFVVDSNLNHLTPDQVATVINWLRRKYEIVPLRRATKIRISTPDAKVMGAVIADLLQYRTPAGGELHVYRRGDETPAN